MDIYANCPQYESEHYALRLVRMADASALHAVYGDRDNLPYFNKDNCIGDFYCEKLEYVEQMIHFWLQEYAQRMYVRFAIVDKVQEQAVGTVEVFHRMAADAFDDCVLLRLDVGREDERSDVLEELVRCILSFALAIYPARFIATKCPSYATERIKALTACGFAPSPHYLVGHDGTKYGDYWVKEK